MSDGRGITMPCCCRCGIAVLRKDDVVNHADDDFFFFIFLLRCVCKGIGN